MSILFLEKLLSDLNLRIENAPDLSSWKKFNADLDKMLSEFQLKLDQYKKEIDLGSLEVLRLAELFQQKEQLLKSIFNASSDMIMTFDSRGQLIEYNHTTPETLGVSAKELSGKNYSEFFLGGSLLADLDLLFKSHNEIFRKSYFDSFKESSVIIINNQELTVSVYANCVSTDKESFYPFYIRDITRQKKLELELVESRAMLESFSKMSSLGEMAGSIAHEINTPLAVIQMRAGMAHELISRKKFESDVLEKCITSIEQTTTKISSIVSGLRTFSRDSQNDSFVESSIKQIVDDTFVLCTERFKNNNVKIIRNEFEDKIISCQPNQISQVLLNLLNNAFDAIEKLDDRWVQVDLSSSNDSIYLAIIDSGSGISKDIQDKIMTPFFTTKERGKGTGLGLSISKKIIEAHGGKLSIDINCSNTKFIIELPTINEVNHG